MMHEPAAGAPPGEGGHLSFLALDRLKLGEPVEPAAAAHLAACPRCTADARPPARTEPAPGWLDALGGHRDSGVRPRRIGLAAGLTSLVAAGAAALLLLPGASPPGSTAPPSGIREKAAAPAIRVYVKRGDELWIWDGRSALQPGDRLRLEIRGAGYSHVSVASAPDAQEPPAVLHEGTLADPDGLLPVSFKVDDERGREVISILLSHRPIPAALHAGAGTTPAEVTTWRQRLIFDKEKAP